MKKFRLRPERVIATPQGNASSERARFAKVQAIDDTELMVMLTAVNNRIPSPMRHDGRDFPRIVDEHVRNEVAKLWLLGKLPMRCPGSPKSWIAGLDVHAHGNGSSVAPGMIVGPKPPTRNLHHYTRVRASSDWNI